jgi:hypothetical protein
MSRVRVPSSTLMSNSDLDLVFGRLVWASSLPTFVGMFTESHRSKTERLVDSLAQFDIPHAIFRVPVVHRSINPRASEDIRYAKPNVIQQLFSLLPRGFVFLDTDLVVRRRPVLFESFEQEQIEFAILNWLCLADNDVWVPVTPTMYQASGVTDQSRKLYREVLHVDGYCETQLMCSGAVQYWRPTDKSIRLLKAWAETIQLFPGVVDDECLDFAFNHLSAVDRQTIAVRWLPKSYARIAWWIFDEPIIDHPEIPYDGSAWRKIDEFGRGERVDFSQVKPRCMPTFRRDLMIDIETNEIIANTNGQLTVVGHFDQQLWAS